MTVKPVTAVEMLLDAIRQEVQHTAQNTTSETTIADSHIIQPVDVQARYQKTVQTHAGVMIGPNAASTQSGWVDSAGFNEISLCLSNSASTSSNVSVFWSNDGVTRHGLDSSIMPGTGSSKAHTMPTRARYFQVMLVNSDTTPQTMSLWAYLKA